MKTAPRPPEPADRTGADDSSMDTILASIRRILNEDEVAPAEAAPERRDPAPAAMPRTDAAGTDQGKDDVLVLGRAMMVPPEKVEPTPPPFAQPPLVQSQTPSLPAPAVVVMSPPAAPPQPVASQPMPLDQATVEGLIAARTRAATTQSFDALHEAMRREQAPPPAPPASPSSPNLLRSGGPTLEDLVRDELRGLISNWLDEHLPGLVETLVRAEIEKLTRRTV